MHPKVQESKEAIRRQIRSWLKNSDPAQRAANSARARLLFEKQTVWNKARAILFYAPLPEELDVWPLVTAALAAGKTVALPRFDSGINQYTACRVQNLAGDVVPGRFGIREPGGRCVAIRLDLLDLVLVPGVAFDLRGRRLGRGKGYYDQLLSGVHGATCGVAFDEQVVAEVPVEPHDARVCCLLTPTRWILLNGPG